MRRFHHYAPHSWDHCGVLSRGGPHRRRRVVKPLLQGLVRSGGDVLPAALAAATVTQPAASVAAAAASLAEPAAAQPAVEWTLPSSPFCRKVPLVLGVHRRGHAWTIPHRRDCPWVRSALRRSLWLSLFHFVAERRLPPLGGRCQANVQSRLGRFLRSQILRSVPSSPFCRKVPLVLGVHRRGHAWTIPHRRDCPWVRSALRRSLWLSLFHFVAERRLPPLGGRCQANVPSRLGRFLRSQILRAVELMPSSIIEVCVHL